MSRSRRRGVPWLTAAVSAIAVLFYITPGAFEALSYRRTEILSGQWWRLVTGHLTHGSLSHLLWTVSAFLVLGGLVELRLKRAYPVFLMGNALALGLGLLLLKPDLPAYCGLSGLVTGLFGYLLLDQWASAWREGDVPILALCVLCAAALAGKIVSEVLYGRPLLVHSSGIVPVPLAHFLGALAGAAAFTTGRLSLGPQKRYPTLPR